MASCSPRRSALAGFTLVVCFLGSASCRPPDGGRTIAPEEPAARSLARAARARLAGQPAAPLEGSRSCEPRCVLLLSQARPAEPALVARGEGSDLEEALAAAVEALRRISGGAPDPAGVAGVKADLLLDEREEGSFDDEGRAAIDRSLDGLWLPGPDLLLLPEELLSRRLTRSDGDLQSKRLRRYLAETGRTDVDIGSNPGRAGMPYFRVRFESAFSSAAGEVDLYRGNPASIDLTPESLLAAARAGGDYLLRHHLESGEYGYAYEAKKDTYDDDYNLLRHAGTSYALFELAAAAGDQRYLDAGRRGVDWLLEQHLRPPLPADREADFLAVVSPGEEAKLGGAALALLAILEHAEVTGEARWMETARALARFQAFMQEESGRFESKYFYGQPDAKPFNSIYYPGESILALTRLSFVDSSGPWRETAERAARWLIEVRDADKAVEDLPHDHWLLMGLDELTRTAPAGDPAKALFSEHADRISRAILGAQRSTPEPYPDWLGTFYDPPRSTPTATRAEALVARVGIAKRAGEDPAPFVEALRRAAGFQLRTQLVEANALYLPRPDLAAGGFRRSLTDWEVRIDYVQHNVSALLGLRRILLEEDSGL